MLGPEDFLTNCKCSFIRGFCFSKVAHSSVKFREVEYVSRSVWMLGSQRFFIDLECLLKEWFSFQIVAHRRIQRRQASQRIPCIMVVRAKYLLPDLERAFE